MPTVVLRGHIFVPAEDLVAVRRALPKHIDNTRAEPGCLKFEVNEDSTELGRFNVYEEFQDQAAFERHQACVRLSDWGRISQNVERHYQIDTRQG